jgi:hypothetical protein
VDAATIERIEARLRWQAEQLVAAAIGPIAAGVKRRHSHEHARIAEYFGAMIGETVAPRRKVDPGTVASRIAAIVADRDAKLRTLQQRFTLHVHLTPAALLWVEVPCVHARVRIRRRKESREVMLRLPAGEQELDHLGCDGCSGSTPRPAVCDGRLHLLCERCVPQLQGRIPCSVCARQATNKPVSWLR